MKTIYYPQDDILEIRLRDKPVAREVSQDWNVNVSYAEDGSVVELVILDAVKAGLMPFQGGDRKAIAKILKDLRALPVMDKRPMDEVLYDETGMPE